MVYIVVSFPNGIATILPDDFADDTRMHIISARIHAQRGLQAATYVHLGFCRTIAADQQSLPGADVQTEIVRLSETTTVAEALILVDQQNVAVVGTARMLSLVGHTAGILMIPPPPG